MGETTKVNERILASKTRFALTTRSIDATEFSILETPHRIYTNLFEDPADDARAKALSKALDQFIPNDAEATKGPALAELKRLNGDEESGFGVHELRLLQKVMKKTRSMSPVHPQLGASTRKFWKAVVAGPVQDFVAFSGVAHAYFEKKTADNFAHVEERMKALVPGATFTKEQVEDVVNLCAEDPAYKSLQWWDAFGDAW